MKHCANPDCPYRQRHGSAAEFQDTLATCTDCGTALVDGSAPAPVKVATPSGPAPWARLGVSIGFGVLFIAAMFVPLPGTEALRHELRSQRGLLGLFNISFLPLLSIAALGLTPIISAYLMVEIAAVVVPGWRHLRLSGEPGRAKLRTFANGLTGLLSVIQAAGIARYLQSQEMETVGRHSLGFGMPWLVLVVLLLTTLGIGLSIMAINRWGLGDGFSVLFFASFARSLLEFNPFIDPEGFVIEFIIIGMAVGAVIWATVRALQRRWPFAIAVEPFSLELPPSGLVPITFAASLITFFSSITQSLTDGRLNLRGALGGGYVILLMILVASLGVALTLLFNQPRRVAEVWFGKNPSEASVSVVRRQLAPAAIRGTAFLLVLVLLREGMAQAFRLSITDFALFVALAAIALDLSGEWRFRRSHPELVDVWPMHRVYAAQPVLAALKAAGIPAFVRGLHYRTLLQFGGSYVPMTVLVPPTHVEAAKPLVGQRLMP
ncbi:MAG: hypothetical protein JST54_00545 [Deltaproteobacteria bacterium]|nr:hypothetical protein [Deltaproteobacteria bacterium]